MIDPVQQTSDVQLNKQREAVAVYRVVLRLGKEILWTSKASYSLGLARGYIQGIRMKLRSPSGINQLSNQIGKPLTLGLDYSVGLIERYV